MAPIDVVVGALEAIGARPRVSGDRGRAIGLCHGGKRDYSISFGVGSSGQAMIKCFAGCHIDTVVATLGLEITDLFPPRESHAGKPARRRLISAGQALELLDREAMLVVVAASELAQGRALDEPTRERLLLGAARVSMLRDEVHA